MENIVLGYKREFFNWTIRIYRNCILTFSLIKYALINDFFWNYKLIMSWKEGKVLLAWLVYLESTGIIENNDII